MYDCILASDGLTVTLSDRQSGVTARFHAIWLRDNAWDDTTRSPANGQRLITLKDISADLRISAATVVGGQLQVSFAPEDRTIAFDLPWLMARRYDRSNDARQRGWLADGLSAWDASLQANLPTASFADLEFDEAALFGWLDQLVRHGFAHMSGGPVENGALMRVIDLFGYVRETNYGRQFEVRTEVNPTNLAYTGVGLQAHTDNPYRDPVPTLQILYCLESSAEGGENMVVDGFAAAQRLQAENPAWFDVLADHCVNFEFAGDSKVSLTARRPMIELAPDGELTGVRFNNRSAAAITDVPFDSMALFYEAYRRFGEIIDDPAMEVSFRLEPGECFIVDNRRVLHARKAYSGTGTRWLQGAYADCDSLHSKHRVLAGRLAAASAAQ